MKTIFNLLFAFDKPSIEELAAYQHKIPKSITVNHSKDKTGLYIAKVVKIDGIPVKGLILTEAKNTNKLIEMVNDAVYSYLDIPERIRPNLPKMLPKDIDFADRFTKKGELIFAK